jgi:hypothetical protein
MTDRDKDPDATPQMDKFDEWESDGALNEFTDEQEQSVPAGMRQKLSDQASEIATLKQQLSEREGENRATTMSHAFERIGLNPNERVGKAVAVTFDGEPDQLEAFAEEEFRHVFAGAPHPMYAAIQDQTARLDQIGQTAPLLPRHKPMCSLMLNHGATMQPP